MCRQKALLQCLTYRPSFTGSRVIAKIVPTCRFVWLLRSLKSFEQIIWRTIKLSLHGKTCRKKGGKRCSLKKILHQTIFFSAHEIAQPCRYTTSEAFQAGKGVCDIYTVLNLECYKRARKRFHCANCLVILGTLEGRLVGRHLNRGCTCSLILGLFLEKRNSSQIFFRFSPRTMSGTAFP